MLFSYLPLYLSSHVGESRYWLISLVPATPALIRFVMAPHWGRQADAVGSQRSFVVMGLLAYSALLALLPLMAHTESIVLLIALLAIAFSAFNPVIRSWLTLQQPQKGLQRLARWHQWEACGYFVTAGLVGWLAMDEVSALVPLMRWIAAALSACALLVMFFTREMPTAVAVGELPTKRRSHRRWTWGGGRKMLLPLSLLAFLLVSSLGWEAVANMFGLYFTKEIGGPLHIYGAIISASTLVSLVTYGLLAEFGKKRGYRSLLRLSAWGYTCMYALMALRSPWTVALAYLIPMSTLVHTACNVFITEYVPESQRGTAMGRVESVESSTILIGALAGGLLADFFGLYAVPLAALASSALLHVVAAGARRRN